MLLLHFIAYSSYSNVVQAVTGVKYMYLHTQIFNMVRAVMFIRCHLYCIIYPDWDMFILM